MDNGKASLEEGPDNEREGGNTYLFYSAIHEEVEGVRGNDDGIAERCRIYINERAQLNPRLLT